MAVECDHKIGLNDRFYFCRKCNQGWPREETGVLEGPGTRLYAALEKLGLPHCDECLTRAFAMDLWGPEGCRKNRETILRWLRSEASRVFYRGRMDDFIWAWIEERGIFDSDP